MACRAVKQGNNRAGLAQVSVKQSITVSRESACGSALDPLARCGNAPDGCFDDTADPIEGRASSFARVMLSDGACRIL